MTGLIIDLLLVAAVIIIVVLAARRGILSTIATVLAFVLAIVLASFCAKPVAKVMYKAFFYKNVQRALYEVLPDNTSGLTNSQKAQYAYDSMPEFARKQAEKVGINVNTFTTQLAKIKLGNGNMYETLEDKLVRPVATEILKHICYFFLAVIFGIILRLIFGSVAKGMKENDTIEKLDTSVGAIIGIVEGLVVVFLVCNLLVYIQPRIEKPETRQAISDSKIVEMCEKFDPMEAVSMAQAFLEE